MPIHFKPLFAIVIALTYLICGAVSAASSDGNVFSSDDQRVSFWTPGIPKKIVESFPSRTGAPYKRTMYIVEAANYMLLVGLLDFQKESIPTTGDENGFLDTMLESMRKGFGSSFILDPNQGISNLDMSAPKLKGRQLKGRLQGQQITLRAYIAAHTIYMQQIMHTPQDKNLENIADRFLSSLVIHVEHP